MITLTSKHLRSRAAFAMLFIWLLWGNATLARAQPRYALPLKSIRVTSGYGPRKHPLSGELRLHRGTDLAARSDSVHSILTGTVKTIGHHHQLGLYLITQHGELEITYGHLGDTWVHAGQKIYAGQQIARTGASGQVTGEHLHLSIRYRGRYLNPMRFLEKLVQNTH